MSIPFDKLNYQYKAAAGRLAQIKSENHYDPTVRPGPPTRNPLLFAYDVCKLSNPFEDETVVIYNSGLSSFSNCSCEFARKKQHMCFHIAAVIEYVDENPLPAVTFESPGLRITESKEAVIFACKRSGREYDAAMRDDPPRRCGCGKTIKSGFRCKACQLEWEAQQNFDAVIEKDKSDLFG